MNINDAKAATFEKFANHRINDSFHISVVNQMMDHVHSLLPQPAKDVIFERVYTRENIVAMMEHMINRPDILIDVSTNENTDWDADGIVDMMMEDLEEGEAGYQTTQKSEGE